GHNVHDFDLPFIRQRSWIRGVRPTGVVDLRRYYTVDVRDTLQIWTNWGFKKQGVTLDALGAALECGQKSGHGFDVSQWPRGTSRRSKHIASRMFEFQCSF